MSKRVFASPDVKEKILNKCPICGEELEYISLGQYSDVYRILKNGKISKTRKSRKDNGLMECGFICCSKCNFHTDCYYDTDTTVDYKKIHIHMNNKEQFVFEAE